MSVELKHTNVKTNGVTLHVVQAGREDAPLMILLHGFPEFWYGWKQQIDPLVALGYRVWVPDQRGYNLSDKPKGIRAYNLDETSADVIGLIDAAGCEKVMGMIGARRSPGGWRTNIPNGWKRLSFSTCRITRFSPKRCGQAANNAVRAGIWCSSKSAGCQKSSSGWTAGALSPAKRCFPAAPVHSATPTWRSIVRRGRSPARSLA
jgi:hypothetical protein